jgi:hypothetical protein
MEVQEDHPFATQGFRTHLDLRADELVRVVNLLAPVFERGPTICSLDPLSCLGALSIPVNPQSLTR